MNPQLHPSGNRIACYDNKAGLFRYVVVYLDHPEGRDRPKDCEAVVMSERPPEARGFGKRCMVEDSPSLGEPILFADLPADCQKLVNRDLNPAPTT